MNKVETVEVQSNIDRRTCSRTKPMQVLVLGLCRTGTLCKLVSFPLRPNQQALVTDFSSNMVGAPTTRI